MFWEEKKKEEEDGMQIEGIKWQKCQAIGGLACPPHFSSNCRRDILLALYTIESGG